MSIPPFGAVPLPGQSGNSGKYLTTDGSKASWGTVSAGGQSPYTYIVAASGGDYTTLGAALAAAANGDTIFIKDSTTETGSITCSLTDLTIIGGNNTNVQIGLSTYTLTLSGTGVVVENLGFSLSTGQIVASGTYQYWHNCRIAVSGVPASSTGNLYINGQHTVFDALDYYSSSPSSTRSNPVIYIGQYFIRLVNSTIMVTKSGDDANYATAFIGIYNNSVEVSNNYFYSTGNYECCVICNVSNNYIKMNDNYFYNIEGTAIYNRAGSYSTMNNNVIQGGLTVTHSIYNTANYATIVGNNITSSNSYCIESTGTLANITGNIVTGNASNVGIYVTAQTLINANVVYDAATGIQITSGSTNSVVTSNITSTCTTAISDSGTTTVNANNTT